MYKSPIELLCQEMETRIENEIFTAIQNVGVSVDKEELIRALQYDRSQYDKGYQDALDSIVRCQDCKHLFNRIGYYHCTHRRGLREISEDSYCGYGEKREV